MSKYYPVNYEEEYAFLVEGRNPTGSSRWRRNANLYPQRLYHRDYPSGVIYCNPKFSADSSQATLGEIDDPYRRTAVYSAMVAQRCPYRLRAPDGAGPLKGSVNRLSPRPVYRHPEESVTDDEVSGEYVESPRTILKNSGRNDGNGNLQLSYSKEKLLRNLNNFNKHTAVGGRKLKPEEMRMITERLRGRQRRDDQYVCNKSRFLDKSYVQAARVIKGAQTKAALNKKEEPSDSYSVPRVPTKHSQLRIGRRQLAVSSDGHGHIFLGSQRLIQQVSPQFAVLSQEVCSAIPEEQPDTADGKSAEVERPVKLQKEDVTLEFSSSPDVIPRRNSQIRKGRGSIVRATKRNRRVDKRPLAACTYAKFVQKLIGETQATVCKDSRDLHGKLQRSEPNPCHSVSQRSETKSNSGTRVGDDPKPHSAKSNLKVEVSEMLTKLEEIQKLLSKNKASFKEPDVVQKLMDARDQNLSPSEMTVSQNEENPNRVAESDAAQDSFHVIKDNVKSHDPISVLSAQSTIMSLLSSISKKLASNKSYDNEATDAQIFQDIFHSEEECKKKEESKIPLSKVKENASSLASSTSTVYPLPRRNLRTPNHSAVSSVVKVFPVETEVRVQSRATKNTTRKRTGKRCTTIEKLPDTSSDNLDQITVRRRRPKAGSSSTTPGDSILKTSILSSLNSVLCTIIGFLFRYLKTLFIL